MAAELRISHRLDGPIDGAYALGRVERRLADATAGGSCRGTLEDTELEYWGIAIEPAP